MSKLFSLTRVAGFLVVGLMTVGFASSALADGFWNYVEPGSVEVAGLGATIATSASGGKVAICTDKTVTYPAGKNETPITERCLQGSATAFMAYTSGSDQSDILVVFIHGDTYQDDGRVEPVNKKGWIEQTGWAAIDYVKGTGDPQPSILNIIRAGEEVQSPGGGEQTSSGDNLGGKDNHILPYIDDMAAAIRLHMQQVGATRLLIVGHSGGANYATIMPSRHADLAKQIGVISVSCGCDVQAWRSYAANKYNNRSILRETRGENPMDHLNNIRPDTIIWAFTPYNDDVTPSRFDAAYIEALQARGHPNARFVELHDMEGTSPLDGHKYKYQYILPYAVEMFALLRGQN